jgi:hypothetical protein
MWVEGVGGKSTLEERMRSPSWGLEDRDLINNKKFLIYLRENFRWQVSIREIVKNLRTSENLLILDCEFQWV